jgi:electron transport complex protein RnfE
MDGIGMGIGFTLALTLIGSIRELFGNGTLFGLNVFGANFQPMLLLILPAGGFIVYGLLLAAFNIIGIKAGKRKEAANE